MLVRIASYATDLLDRLPVFGDPSPFGYDVARTDQPDLDSALEELGARAVWRVAPSAEWAGGPFPARDLDDLTLVEFDESRSVEDAVARLNAVPEAVGVGPSGGFAIAAVPDDPGFARQWGLVDVRCPQAWKLSTGSPEVVVAVVDTGCDLEHLDLAGQFESPGINTVTAGYRPGDDNGHGTHLAGIVAASGDNGYDVAGVAWRTRLLPVKVLTSSGVAIGASIAQGITWAAEQCSVLLCAVQGGVDDLAVRAAIDGARRRGVVVVTAMGNLGWGENRPSYPAAYARVFDNVIAVGAVDRAHRRSVWSSTLSSNTGSWIGVVAPGTGIDSLDVGGGVTAKSGTSQAGAHVAGAAALVRAVAPDLSPSEVIATITSTAAPLRDAPDGPVPNPAYGYGLLDVDGAVRAADKHAADR